MLRSLRVRLLASFLLVALVAVGVVAVLASQTTSDQFQGYVSRRVEMGHRRYQRILGIYYVDHGNWDGAQALVDRMAEISGDHIVLVDPKGRIIADSTGKLLGTDAGHNWPGGLELITAKGTAVGSVYVNPIVQPYEDAFLASVNRSLLVAVSAAGFLALLLTLALSQRIIAPLASLTAAARQMERGDLRQRVDVRSADEVGELARAFNSMAEAIARNEQLRRNMVSDVAHELRTPLTNIRGYLEALRDHVLTPDQVTLESVHQEAEQLSRLVDDLQQVALAEAGQLQLVRQPTDIAEIVGRAVAAARHLAGSKGVVLTARIAEGLPLTDIDGERIAQVVRNIIANAVTHTPVGGMVTASALQVGDWVEIEIADTGSGIAPDDLPYVFERFYRADPSRSRATGGAGLGLTIARQIIQAHGGQIRAESRPGAGARFIFSIPIHRPPLEPTN